MFGGRLIGKKGSFFILLACSWKCVGEIRLNPIQLRGSGCSALCRHSLYDVGPFLRREVLIDHDIERVAGGASANGDIAAWPWRQQCFVAFEYLILPRVVVRVVVRFLVRFLVQIRDFPSQRGWCMTWAMP